MDQRRLTGAVGAEIPEGAAARDEELDVVHGDVLAEALRQPVCLDGPFVGPCLRNKKVSHTLGAPRFLFLFCADTFFALSRSLHCHVRVKPPCEGYSIGRAAMADGSRPASTQPMNMAATGMAITMRNRLLHGT